MKSSTETTSSSFLELDHRSVAADEDDAGTVSSEGFDQLFADAVADNELRDVMRAGLPDLPDWLDSFNFVPAAGLVEIVEKVSVPEGGLVLDLACGLGGPGLFVAERGGWRVVGVDWSATGCRRAASVAGNRAIDATYIAASGAALPLRDNSVDAAICIDALRFIPGYGVAELRRVLKPAGRLAITAWERDEDDALGAAIPSFSTLLSDGGFSVIADEQRPAWLEAQRRVYAEAVSRGDGASPAVASLASEAEIVAPALDRMRRVLVVAEAPSAGPGRGV